MGRKIIAHEYAIMVCWWVSSCWNILWHIVHRSLQVLAKISHGLFPFNGDPSHRHAWTYIHDAWIAYDYFPHVALHMISKRFSQVLQWWLVYKYSKHSTILASLHKSPIGIWENNSLSDRVVSTGTRTRRSRCAGSCSCLRYSSRRRDP